MYIFVFVDWKPIITIIQIISCVYVLHNYIQNTIGMMIETAIFVLKIVNAIKLVVHNVIQMLIEI